MTRLDHWQIVALMLFAVAAGQVGRLGQALERGEMIGRRKILVELSMLPAFGSIGGALAVEFGWPTWAILVAGVSAGWTGFGTYRLIVGLGRSLAGKYLDATKGEQP